MAVNYAKQFNTRARKERTPQSEPIPESNQVANSAGGFAWQITPWQKLERFLILGAEGGTYYVGQADLIKQSHNATMACLKEDGVKVVKFVQDISWSGRAFKNDPAIFVLALAATHGNNATKAAAYQALPRVCRIGTHLFHFAEYVNAMRGWGRGLRHAVAAWYDRPHEKLALQAVKYQQRDGWSHGDLLRLSHPKANSKEQEAVFRWMVNGVDGFASAERKVKRKVAGKVVERSYVGPVRADLPRLIEAFEEAKKADEKRLIELIVEEKLPREAVPTEKLNSVKVWAALLQHMPLTAMIRNLGKMTSIGLLKPLSDSARLVVDRLGDRENLQKSRVHPMQVLLAMRTYAAGQGFKGSLTWSPVPNILDGLDQAFYATFKNVVPCGKPLLLACDVSGSMDGSMIAGTHISAREATAAMALVTAAVEPEHHIIGFAAATSGHGGKWGGGQSGIVDINITPRMRLDTVMEKMRAIPMGGTDCSLPMVWAKEQRVNVAGFVTYTDNETWHGPLHPSQALREYRKDFVQDARGVVVGMCVNDFTIADPSDRWMLDVAGFDANVPSIISNFIGDVREGSATEDEAVEQM